MPVPGGGGGGGGGGGARRYNRSLSRGMEQKNQACPGGSNKIEACPGGHLYVCPRRVRT